MKKVVIKAKELHLFLLEEVGDISHIDTPEKEEDYGYDFRMDKNSCDFAFNVVGIDEDKDTLIEVRYWPIVCSPLNASQS